MTSECTAANSNMPTIDATTSERPRPLPTLCVAGSLMSLARRHQQPDTRTSHGLDRHREAGELLAQVGEVDVDDVGAGIEVVAERLAQDLRAGHDLALAPHQ